ncbi:hypothetical protein WA026_002180 [Henosepilachna vigintioctopunctata]|uniref:Bms1-type G domain-containing protein n=1 Tax=Henosepilachna vigintioctopunctata TaxID=420089 RepID=A0AAW1TQL7_9CUCU
MDDKTTLNSSTKKSHRDRKSGRKAEKKKFKEKKDKAVEEITDKQRNPKAFTFNSVIGAERKFRRKQDINTKKQHIPLIDRTPLEPPPILIAVVGPPKVGKSTLINNLIKLFTKSPLTEVKGPVTIVTGKKRRITLIECNNDINCMIDLAKVADLVLLLCDASFGFEMEIFEFLNICQVHGMPRIMGILTHLDMIKNSKALKTTKKKLKHRFWTEVYPGAKLFYLSGMVHEEYLRNEIKNLGRFISVMKFRPLTWKSTHSYLLVDRYEDLTNQEIVRTNAKCDRNISLYGYIRGVPLKKQSAVHIAGVGDMRIHELSFLPDPCPLPEQIKKRALVEKEKLIYAPFSGVGGIVYDKDAVYVELGGSHSHKKKNFVDETDNMVTNLIETKGTLDEKIAHSQIQILTGGTKITTKDFVEFNDTNDEFSADSENENDQYKNDNSDTEVSEDEGEDKLKEFPKSKKIDVGGKSKKIKEVTDALDKELASLRKKSYTEEKVEDSGRIRRKVVFTDVLTSSLSDEEKILNENSDIEDEDQEFISDHISDSESESHKIQSTQNSVYQEKNNIHVSNTDNRSCEKGNSIHDKITDVLKHLSQKKINEDESENHNDIDESDDDNISDEQGSSSDSEMDSETEEMKEENTTTNAENDENTMGVKWKENLAKKAQDAFLERQSSSHNLMKLVYGIFDVKIKEENKAEISEDNDNFDDGLLRKVSNQQKKIIMDKESLNAEESSLLQPWNSLTRDWTNPNNKALIVNCFVTGKWKESEDASELLKLDDAEDLSDDNSEIYGDFEDLENETKYTQSESGKRKILESENGENADKLQLAEKKRKLKEKFDAEYDNGEKNSYYDELKLTAEKQSQLNKSCFENMPDEIRTDIEGFRPGMYVRMEFKDVPSELINNFDPTYPIVIGSLNIGEENIGYVNVKIKKHRWYSKILKTCDPLILSLGWRRFQTIPMFSKLEDDLKFRYLKYTPQHLGCNAHFWGPITPQGTGFVALQSVDSNPEIQNKQGFRIAATGVVQELDKSTQIMKKLKLIGYPLKIYKKTAFIKDMFNSSLEVAKFEGARIKTVSGIRGQIKKAITKPEGCFRATFEDKIKLSDIVFCRTWYKVDVPEFYNPVTNLLLPLGEKDAWQGAKTTGEIKRDKNIRTVVNSDHLYEPIVREEKPFAPLVIPRKLQASLPYKDKPKHGIKLSEKKKATPRIAVVREPDEQKISNMMKMIKTIHRHKQEKDEQDNQKRREKFKLMKAAQTASKDKNIKSRKKEDMRKKSKQSMSKKNR